MENKIYSVNLDWLGNDKIANVINAFISNGYTKPQALLWAVFKICEFTVKSIKEARDAFNNGNDIEFNIGTGAMGNVINIIYSPTNKRFEEPLFDLPTLQKLGYNLGDVVAACQGVAATEKLHASVFEKVNR